jgi:hypothetical protein
MKSVEGSVKGHDIPQLKSIVMSTKFLTPFRTHERPFFWGAPHYSLISRKQTALSLAQAVVLLLMVELIKRQLGMQ